MIGMITNTVKNARAGITMTAIFQRELSHFTVRLSLFRHLHPSS
jgi:hypothetical protein